MQTLRLDTAGRSPISNTYLYCRKSWLVAPVVSQESISRIKCVVVITVSSSCMDINFFSLLRCWRQNLSCALFLHVLGDHIWSWLLFLLHCSKDETYFNDGIPARLSRIIWKPVSNLTLYLLHCLQTPSYCLDAYFASRSNGIYHFQWWILFLNVSVCYLYLHLYHSTPLCPVAG